MTTSLYNLTQDMIDLQAKMETYVQEDGTITAPDELFIEYIQLDKASTDKVENILHFVETLEADAEIQEAEYKALLAKFEKHHQSAKVAKNKAARLKAYILWHMQLLGLEKVEGRTLTVKVQKNGGLALITFRGQDVDKVLGQIDFRTWSDDLYHIVFEPDKTALRALATAGEPLPEGIEAQRGHHIRIT
jgi:hypothetical protein